MNRPTTYSDAGVDINEADRAVAFIKEHASKTLTKHVLTSIGSFGAGFQLEGWKKPVLISSADGVGTKLKVAFLTGRHDTVGEDLVNHCVNDIAVQGATPLFFLDYFSVGKLEAKICGSVVSGIARACQCNGCALIGGETAEMPGMYKQGEYDLAGFIVGAVERAGLLTGQDIKPGDILLGLPSNGLHTNGYSLARKVLFEDGKLTVDSKVHGLNGTVGDELLRVHRSYLPSLEALQKAGVLKGAAHITGGGLTDNIPRILPGNCSVEIEAKSWPVQPIFEIIQEMGRVPDEDLRRTFNLGIGMVVVVSAKKLKKARKRLAELDEQCFEIGRVVKHKAKQEKPRVAYL